MGGKSIDIKPVQEPGRRAFTAGGSQGSGPGPQENAFNALSQGARQGQGVDKWPLKAPDQPLLDREPARGQVRGTGRAADDYPGNLPDRIRNKIVRGLQGDNVVSMARIFLEASTKAEEASTIRIDSPAAGTTRS